MQNGINRNNQQQNIMEQNSSQPSILTNQNPNDENSQGQNTNDGQTDDQVSVYMKDNMVMRRIQIEGDEREFLMDP